MRNSFISLCLSSFLALATPPTADRAHSGHAEETHADSDSEKSCSALMNSNTARGVEEESVSVTGKTRAH